MSGNLYSASMEGRYSSGGDCTVNREVQEPSEERPPTSHSGNHGMPCLSAIFLWIFKKTLESSFLCEIPIIFSCLRWFSRKRSCLGPRYPICRSYLAHALTVCNHISKHSKKNQKTKHHHHHQQKHMYLYLNPFLLWQCKLHSRYHELIYIVISFENYSSYTMFQGKWALILREQITALAQLLTFL